MTTYTPTSPNPNGWTNRQYGNTDAAVGHKITHCNGFLPDPAIWPKPPGGYPYVIWLNFQGYNQTSLLTSIGDDQAPQQMLLDQGIAIVWATLPVARDPATTGIPVAQVAGAFNPGAGEFGLAYRGNGHSPRFGKGPSSSPPYPGQFPVGYEAANPGRPHPWVDPNWYSAEKCVEDLVRHCKFNAVELGLDPTRDGIYGNSAGADAALAACKGDRALVAEHIASGGQQAMSTRVAVIALQHPTASRLMFKKELSNGGPAAWALAKRGGSDDHDVGCADYNEDSDSVTLALSATWWLTQHAEWPGMKAANDVQRLWVNSNAPMHADVLADPDRYTNNFGHLGTSTTGETQPHSIYSLYRLMQWLPAGRYVAIDPSHVDPNAVSAGATRQLDAVIEDQATMFADMVDYIVQTIGSPAPAEEQVVTAFNDVLSSVTLANGYQTDVRRVYRWEDVPSSMPSSPFISYRTESTRRDDKSFAGIMVKWLTIDLLLVIKGWQKHESRLSRFEADVERALRLDCTLGGKATNVTAGDSERFLPNPGKGDAAFTVMTVEVQFRHYLNDPYTLQI